LGNAAQIEYRLLTVTKGMEAVRANRGKAIGITLLTAAVLCGALVCGASASWKDQPLVPRLSAKDQAKLRSRVAGGLKAGLRAGVFAKVGDSNTEFAPNLYGFACRTPVGLSPALSKTLSGYNRIRLTNERSLPGCQPSTSFSRRSSAAQAGVFSSWSVNLVERLPDTSYWAKPPGCPLEGTPLSCELDAIRPRYALILLGTNDLGMDITFGHAPGSMIAPRLGGVIKALLARSVVPVLSTIPPVVRPGGIRQKLFDQGVRRTNRGIWRLARAWHLPMINLWRAMEQPFMINHGLADDGMHLRVYGNDGSMVGLQPEETTFANSVDFRPRALRNGANRRNLLWLRTLSRLDRITG